MRFNGLLSTVPSSESREKSLNVVLECEQWDTSVSGLASLLPMKVGSRFELNENDCIESIVIVSYSALPLFK